MTRCPRFALGMMLLGCFGASRPAIAQVSVRPVDSDAHFFSGVAGKVFGVVSNETMAVVETEITVRLFQLSSATGAGVAELKMDRLRLSPGEETPCSVSFTMPEVSATTPYLVQWATASGRVVGKTRFEVHPTNLLSRLLPNSGGFPITVHDETGALGLCLKRSGFPVQEALPMSETNNPSSPLVLVADPSAGSGTSSSIVEDALENGQGVVWYRTSQDMQTGWADLIYLLPNGARALVIVDRNHLLDLDKNPKAQLRLAHASRLALNPTIPGLSELALQPLTRKSP